MSRLDTVIIKNACDSLGLTVVDGDGVHTSIVTDNKGNVVVDGGYPYVRMCLGNMLKEQAHQAKLFEFNNRVDGINKLHSFLSAVDAPLKEYLANGYKLKVDGSFHLKDSIALNEIIRTHGGGDFHRSQLKISGTAIQVDGSIWIKKDSESGSYYTNWISVWDIQSNEPVTRDQNIPQWHVKDLINAHELISGVIEEKRALESVIGKYNYLLGTNQS